MKPSGSPTTKAPAVAPTATGILQQLKDGNARWAAGRPTRPDQSVNFRNSLVGGQQPKAVVLACTDSRVPPEMIFDQGLNTLVVVRTGGQAVDDLVLGSVEAGVDAGATLVFVLGHENCDVLAAAVRTLDAHATAPGREQAIVDAVTPAYTAAKAAGGKTENTIVTEQVKSAMGQLGADPALAAKVASGRLSIVGGEYELDTGKVTMVS